MALSVHNIPTFSNVPFMHKAITKMVIDNVRYWLKADITERQFNVRYPPESGHSTYMLKESAFDPKRTDPQN